MGWVQRAVLGLEELLYGGLSAVSGRPGEDPGPEEHDPLASPLLGSSPGET